MIPLIPDDAIDVLRQAFSAANNAVARRLCRLPNVWETSLDQALIDTLADWGGPVAVDSGWTVRIETHFLGGGKHWGPEDGFYPPLGRWEIADIGVLAMIRNGSRLVRTKLAMLQSKRLYPDEQPIDEAEAAHFRVGFGRLYESEAYFAAASAPRLFVFGQESQYKQLLVGDQQVERIRAFEVSNKTPVHYLLYNPSEIPWTQSHPLPSMVEMPDDNRVGCRVVAAEEVRAVLGAMTPGNSPSYGRLSADLPSPYGAPIAEAGWRLEDFIERLVTCKEGYRAEDSNDTALGYVFNRRGGPIAAAIGVTLAAPDESTESN